MNFVRSMRSLVFSLVLLLIAGSISYADLPLTDRLEEYIAFVLTTDFDYETWVEKAGGTDLLTRLANWSVHFSWFDNDWGARGVPVGPADPVR